MLVRDGGRLRFSHPLIAAVVQERTPPGEWRAIHARLAELTDQPEQRARHLAAAADGPDEDVAAELEAAAGEAAIRGATMAAADLAERAAELTPATDQAVRLRRLITAAEASMAVGDGPRARSYAATAASSSRASSAAVCCRSPGALASARSTASPSDGGSPGRTSSSAGGGSWMCAHSFSTSLSRS